MELDEERYVIKEQRFELLIDFGIGYDLQKESQLRITDKRPIIPNINANDYKCRNPNKILIKEPSKPSAKEFP